MLSGTTVGFGISMGCMWRVGVGWGGVAESPPFPTLRDSSEHL